MTAVVGVVLAILAGPLLGSPAAATRISGRTFYVSASGSDANSGLSPSHAWRSVARVNRAHLRPGDGVLFHGGQSFGGHTLMPGGGTEVWGSRGAPIVFGSYGQRNASLPRGIWTNGERYLVFQSLNLGPQQGLTGSGQHITMQNCQIDNILHSGAEIAVNTNGSFYTIRNNAIDDTGNSGMLLLGSHYLIEHNTITNTGLDPAITYGAHGVYLKAADSTVTANTIIHFHNQGVSARYRNSTISHNLISDGEIGIGWHQYDTRAGTSHWTYNTITNTTTTGIYISPHDIGGDTREHFVIAHNTITSPTPKQNWIPMNLDTHNPVTLIENTTN
jgi:hypothetical protein